MISTDWASPGAEDRAKITTPASSNFDRTASARRWVIGTPRDIGDHDIEAAGISLTLSREASPREA